MIVQMESECAMREGVVEQALGPNVAAQRGSKTGSRESQGQRGGYSV